MTNIMPRTPAILPAGNYDPAGLLFYFDECFKNRITMGEIASDLRTDVDRIQYFTGDGRAALVRRAGQQKRKMT